MGEFMRAKTAMAMADALSFYCAITIVGLMVSGVFREDQKLSYSAVAGNRGACEEIYVVGERETLHTISDKCGDPFIIEKNPHIHDPDDVFPGLVIKITPSSSP